MAPHLSRVSVNARGFGEVKVGLGERLAELETPSPSSLSSVRVRMAVSRQEICQDRLEYRILGLHRLGLVMSDQGHWEEPLPVASVMSLW